MTNKELKQLEEERKTYAKSQTTKAIAPSQQSETQMQSITQLNKEVVELKKKLKELEKKVDDSNRFQKDFSGIQIFDREVQFRSKVRNLAGTVVIN